MKHFSSDKDRFLTLGPKQEPKWVIRITLLLSKTIISPSLLKHKQGHRAWSRLQVAVRINKTAAMSPAPPILSVSATG